MGRCSELETAASRRPPINPPCRLRDLAHALTASRPARPESRSCEPVEFEALNADSVGPIRSADLTISFVAVEWAGAFSPTLRWDLDRPFASMI